MIELIGRTNIDFMGRRRLSFALSAALVLLGLLALVQIWRGQANLGIDFAGGTAVQVAFQSEVALQDIREALEEAGLEGFDLQDLPTLNKVLIRVKGSQAELGVVADRIIATLKERFAQAGPVIDSVTEIGPKVGRRLRDDAIVAIIAASIGLLLYVGLRFQFRFSLGAVAATLHDVLAVLGAFYLMGKEINLILVSALLITAGYSLTDTVVVFDRIRENLRRSFRTPVEVLINRSINEVLSRTIITSLTTLFAAGALYVLGGEVLHDFALAIILGIVVGTYSSVFVASPVVLALWGKRAVAQR